LQRCQPDFFEDEPSPLHFAAPRNEDEDENEEEKD
jgi:hypothetical protein